jgi:hypothetical protein
MWSGLRERPPWSSDCMRSSMSSRQCTRDENSRSTVISSVPSERPPPKPCPISSWFQRPPPDMTRSPATGARSRSKLPMSLAESRYIRPRMAPQPRSSCRDFRGTLHRAWSGVQRTACNRVPGSGELREHRVENSTTQRGMTHHRSGPLLVSTATRPTWCVIGNTYMTLSVVRSFAGACAHEAERARDAALLFWTRAGVGAQLQAIANQSEPNPSPPADGRRRSQTSAAHKAAHPARSQFDLACAI